MPNLPLIPGTLPGGATYCPATWQQAYNDFFSNGYAYLSAGVANVWKGDTPPVDPTVYPIWVRTSAGNAYFPPLWVRTGGSWVAMHPQQAGSERHIWVGTEANLWAYDGGDGTDPIASPPTDTTGAMWQVDTQFAAIMPIGVGTLPAGTVIPQGGTGGEDVHTLLATEMPVHHHTVTQSVDLVLRGAADRDVVVPNWAMGAEADSVYDTSDAGGSAGATVPHQNMPPYLGVYFIKRTARKYYVY